MTLIPKYLKLYIVCIRFPLNIEVGYCLCCIAIIFVLSTLMFNPLIWLNVSSTSSKCISSKAHKNNTTLSTYMSVKLISCLNFGPSNPSSFAPCSLFLSADNHRQKSAEHHCPTPTLLDKYFEKPLSIFIYNLTCSYNHPTTTLYVNGIAICIVLFLSSLLVEGRGSTHGLKSHFINWG